MNKSFAIELTEEEAKFVLATLDRAAVQGIGTARMIVGIAERIASAQVARSPAQDAVLPNRGTLATSDAKPANGSGMHH